jgi:hypothetical protein
VGGSSINKGLELGLRVYEASPLTPLLLEKLDTFDGNLSGVPFFDREVEEVCQRSCNINPLRSLKTYPLA